MSKKTVIEKVSEAGDWLLETAADSIKDAKMRREDALYDEGYNEGRNKQKEKDVIAAVEAFLELKIKEQEIYRLLSDYFDVDSVSEVTALLKAAKKRRQIKALKSYCESKGMTFQEFREYAREHRLSEKLDADESLLEIKPDKLKTIVEKK